MQPHTHLQIVCAQAQRFSDPPAEPGVELEEVRAAAADLAATLSVLPEPRSSRLFARHWKSLKKVLQPLLAELEALPEDRASEEFRWLQENTRLLNTALQDSAELAKLKRTPHVRTAGGAVVPRVAAFVEAYFTAVNYCFDARAFAAFLDAFQEISVLNMAEIWALVPCLKLVLLREITARGCRLLQDGCAEYGVADAVRSLHHIGQTSWKDLLEPRILIDRILREDPTGAYPAMDFETRERYWNAVAAVAAHSDRSEMDVAIEALSLAQEAQRASRDDDTCPRLASRRAHVGYYLIAEGSPVLHRRVGFHAPLRQKIASSLRRRPNAWYLSGIHLVTLSIIAALLLLVAGNSVAAGPLVLAILVLWLPCSQIAVELMNYVTTLLVPAQLLPKLDYSGGIPDHSAAVVAVPALLLNEREICRLVEDLEVRYLGNRDRNLHFALLSDLPDAKEPGSEDDPRVALAAELISQLNEKYAGQGGGSFLLLHRHRVYNAREGVWMGWERKRGKLMDFAKLLRREYDAFPVKAGDLSPLPRVRFVIMLDADTELPRGSAHRMIGTLAHPLNQPIIDAERNVVSCGYGIVQPRVGVSIQSAARSRLANIYSGETGLDIYTRAVSDVYQDLYREAIFTGKGICEVDALLQVLNHRFPENALLSHDLIEGAYVRTGLASDIELIDDYPSDYSAYSRRKHRWTRGDWQIAEWLLPRVPGASGSRVLNPLSLVSRWKIFDNLRRSLLEPATFLMLVLAWLVLPGSPLRWTVAIVLLLLAPAWFQFGFGLLRAAWKHNLALARSSFRSWLEAHLAALLRLTFLAHQMLLSADAIVRALVRRLVTRRGLLEWQTAAEAESLDRGRSVTDVYFDWLPLVPMAVALLVWLVRPAALLAAAPILLLWIGSKRLAVWLNQPPRTADYKFSTDDRFFLRRVALRTWRYFAEWSNEEHHWLVPDNVQQEPPRVAARTSPTDLGVLLNARQAACELGYLTVPEFAQMTARTLATMEALPKYRGHLFNWYDTRTLAPLAPRFVSSADSGNLAAALWSLQQGCLEWLRRPLLQPSLLDGFIDHLLALDDQGTPARVLAQVSERSATAAGDWLQTMRELTDEFLPESGPDGGARSGWFAEQARARQKSIASIVARYCPWLLPEFSSLCEQLALQLKAGAEEKPLRELPAFIEAASTRLASAMASAPADQQPLYASLQVLLDEARQNAVQLIHELRQIAKRAGQLARDMDFRFLFNRWRKLLSVGFDVDAQRLNPACYDLLASEARLAVFIAIAKEDIPQETWFLLGRSHELDQGRPVLLSWTGTMFEYLMPSLWMRTYPNTLLERAQAEAVRSQQAHAARKHTPWGISESAYAKRDEAGQYQYRAFGVPSLALHKDETEALVISPYSTLLALPIDGGAALRTLRRMAKDGWLATYGFYEAADYSPAHPRRRHSCELVRCWMAHHQGMSLLAIANRLHENILQRWFHENPRVQATELLLQEKPVSWVRRSSVRRGTAAA